jgi:hypothetical protein
MVNLCRKGIKFNFLVHRLVLEAFVGSCPDSFECCHKDGNPLNNRLENLRWGSRSENRLDAVNHGTNNFLRGELNVKAKLTWEEVRLIRRLYKTGKFSQPELAEMFDVASHSVIWKIIHHHSWIE